MRIYWKGPGLVLEPESDAEDDLLVNARDFLSNLKFGSAQINSDKLSGVKVSNGDSVTRVESPLDGS